MPVLFAVTLFLSATLLFLVQPMIAKMILPKLGGTPAVWNTCMVFFQAALLAGYSYAHATTTWLGVRRQALVHSVLVFLPLLVLPIAVSAEWSAPADSNPVPWVLWLLLVSAGLPFFVVSTSAPLLQKWFAGTGHPSAQDPYFLYAASNLGSMLALGAYPALLEPNLPLEPQSNYWRMGYGVFAFLTAACAVALWLSPAENADAVDADRSFGAEEAPSPWKRAHWVALAFVPSSLMLGATTYLSTDIAPIPLIWVVPLGLYLLSFILVFARLPGFVHQGVILILPVLVLLNMFLNYSGLNGGLGSQITLNLLTLFFVAMACHGELARQRPPTRYLTGYYLWMSLGGVLGGMFNALLAPLIFKEITEYYLVLVFACLLLPRLDAEKAQNENGFESSQVPFWKLPTHLLRQVDQATKGMLLNIALPLILGGATLWILMYFDSDAGRANAHKVFEWVQERATAMNRDASAVSEARIRSIMQYGTPVILCYLLVSNPLRFGLGVAAIMLANVVFLDRIGADRDVIYRDRSFFGVLKVERDVDEEGGHIRLLHGTTLHGMQRCELGAPQRNCEPLTYYHRTGPIGHLFDALDQDRRPMGVIGLGTGTLACYAQPGQELTFFEIDSAVVKIARDPRFFTNLTDAEARGVDVKITMGDARLSLLKVPDGHFRIIFVDAFSSDAIPIHLITREALQLYMKKLTPDGIVVFHISNRYLDLEPVLANLAEAEGLTGGLVLHGEEDDPESCASTWVPIARKPADLKRLIYFTEASDQTRLLEAVRMLGCPDGPLGKLLLLEPLLDARAGRQWHRLGDEEARRRKASDTTKTPVAPSKVGVWSDDYSNVLSIFSWR